MRLGVMQPYFFPYFQQYRHIAQCDLWVVFDTVKYSRKTWVSRNRILNRQRGWQYIAAPVVRGASLGSIAEAELAPGEWRERDVLSALKNYRHDAPNYEATCELVREILHAPARTIADLNTHALKRVARQLGIDTPILRLSEMNLDLPKDAGPGEWGLLIAEAMSADIYSNAPGGTHLFDPAQFEAAGIQLEFYTPIPLTHPTGSFTFEPGLSVIDTLMWMTPDALRSYLPGATTIVSVVPPASEKSA